MKINKLFLALFIIMMIANHSSAQYCTLDDRFTNFEYFSSNEIDSRTDVTYGNAMNEQGNSEALILDYYFPNNSIDALAKRPFILLIHGGGFVGGDKSSCEEECKEFAKRGYVAATINYRLGYDQSSTLESIKAVYRAQQDANAALRYFVENANAIRIDTSWLFIGGSSAGAITSLLTTYSSPEKWAQASPEFESTLGPLDSSGNDLKHTFKIKGIYNLMGSAHPNVLDLEALIPTISFHGELDKVVPIGKSRVTGYGSREIHKLLAQAGICNDLTIVQGGEHNIYKSQGGLHFRINRVASFFKSLFCDTCTSTIFTDSVVTSKKDIDLEVLSAIKDGNIQKLDALTGKEDVDKCHNINGGLYNYLAFSIKLESLESLKYFVNKKANLEGNCTGKTPLMYAAKYGQFDAVKYLLLNGAKLNATNNGKSALDYVVNYKHSEIKKYLEEYNSD